MSSVKITLKAGSVREFGGVERSGRSRVAELSLEGAWAVVRDEWGRRTIFPAAEVAEIIDTPDRY